MTIDMNFQPPNYFTWPRSVLRRMTIDMKIFETRVQKTRGLLEFKHALIVKIKLRVAMFAKYSLLLAAAGSAFVDAAPSTRSIQGPCAQISQQHMQDVKAGSKSDQLRGSISIDMLIRTRSTQVPRCISL